jgi:hypothetical protein
MGYNEVSSFPTIFKVVLEPLYTSEVDEVSGLIKKEKFWSREEYFSECNLSSFTS